MASTQDYPPIFIVSTGRCGSTLMSRLVRMHPRILSISEFFMSIATRAFVRKYLDGEQFWALLSRSHPGERLVFNPEQLTDEFLYPYNENSRFTRATLPPLLYITLPHMSDDHDALYFELEPIIRARPLEPLEDQLAFLFGWLRDRLGKDLWVERSGASLTFLPVLKELFPKARFIHVYRDGRDVAMSMTRHAPTRLYAHTWRTAGLVGANPLKRPFLLGETPLVPLLEKPMIKLLGIDRNIDRPLAPAVTGAFWADMIKHGLANLADLPPERVLSMRYEDLVERPREELSRFINFVGPALAENAWLDAAAAIPRYKEPAWKALPADERVALEAAVDPGMKLLGYRA